MHQRTNAWGHCRSANYFPPCSIHPSPTDHFLTWAHRGTFLGMSLYDQLRYPSYMFCAAFIYPSRSSPLSCIVTSFPLSAPTISFFGVTEARRTPRLESIRGAGGSVAGAVTCVLFLGGFGFLPAGLVFLRGGRAGKERWEAFWKADWWLDWVGLGWVGLNSIKLNVRLQCSAQALKT